MKREIRILMVEDNPDDFELIKHALTKGGISFQPLRVDTKEDFSRELEHFRPDLILSDYQLPTFDGISALAVAVIEAPDVPFIFVSGAIGEQLAIETLKGGATDYVFKGHLNQLAPAVSRALEEAREKRARRSAEDGLRQTLVKLQRTLDQTVEALASITEIRDPYTAGHQQRVAQISSAIGEEFGLPRDMVEGIHVAGTLHDIGKIAVPAEILTKPSKLLEMEFGLVKTHPQVGYQILKGIEFPWPVAEAVLQHHERLDGSGYPRGLSANEIISEARILAVADVVEAMASHRPYRPAFGIDMALDEILRGRGTIFDPEVCDACIRLFEEKGFDPFKQP
ncbi:MAG TPA: HD domain-containing phosphohydrolase [Candidatus Anoxymicrobiaceae bacterium]